MHARHVTLLVLCLLSLPSCIARQIPLEIDVRIPRDVLESIDMYPVSVDVLVESGRSIFAKRLDIVCGVPERIDDVIIVTSDTEALPCRSITRVAVELHPVDLAELSCEDLSLNGRQSFFFEADREIVLASAVAEDVFDETSCRRGTEIVTLAVE